MFLDTVNLHKEFLVQPEPAKSDADMRQILYLYETTLEALSDRISSSLTDYDMYQLVIAPVSMLMVSLGPEVKTFFSSPEPKAHKVSL